MDVEIIASRVSDNYFYGLKDGGEAALIDPVDGSTAVDWVRGEDLQLRYLLNTHFHPDHTGGNPTVLSEFTDVQLVAGATDADRIVAQLDGKQVDRRVTHGDELTLGSSTLRVLDTPGHTPGHVSLVHGDRLFSGDTIFVGGAGNCNFGGDPGDLFRSFRDVLPEIDDETTFYPGHDYAVRDIEFILSIEPDNEEAREMLERAKATPEGEIFLTTLGEERSYNPFFRVGESGLRDRLASEHSDLYARSSGESRSEQEAAFRTIRELRNQW